MLSGLGLAAAGGAISPLTVIGTAAAGGTGLINSYLQYRNQKYMKHVQNEEWRREDNAVQRRAADLQAAGLSKTLAAGSSASSGPVVNTSPVQFDGNSMIEAAQTAAQMMQMDANIAQTKAQEELTRHQIKNVDANTAKTAVDTADAARNLELAKKSGMASNVSGIPKMIKNAIEGVGEGSMVENAELKAANKIRELRHMPPLTIEELRSIKRSR